MLVARRLLVIGTACLCAGCTGWQSALDPQGPQASSLYALIALLVAVCALVWCAVALVLVSALWRRRPPGAAPRDPQAESERRMATAVTLAVAATVVVIAGLTLASFLTTRTISATGTDALQVRVRGYQWWWEVTYPDAGPARAFATANEIHVPTGRPVRLELHAEDVIHSFWAPSLAGKQDLIPGRTNTLTFTVARPGVYRGQCAEFCGLQHAHMALLVVAEDPQSFAAWRARQVAGAAAPRSAESEAGARVFNTKSCGACHAIRGTPADGTLGPDLTHVGSRRYIAAGLLETTRGSLAAWIADPQTLKPGNHMPLVPLAADELKAVSAYLADLE
jgi:cytochrome c oxidase subunit 2